MSHVFWLAGACDAHKSEHHNAAMFVTQVSPAFFSGSRTTISSAQHSAATERKGNTGRKCGRKNVAVLPAARRRGRHRRGV